jgi:hypothetical protein
MIHLHYDSDVLVWIRTEDLQNRSLHRYCYTILLISFGFRSRMLGPPTVQNRYLPQCSKGRRYLYATACSLAVGTPTQALPNQRS